ncbi:unnamed protein product, partial [Vitis vinifera]|uniref:Translocon at the inner envelope membrane of chloroplasts 214 n=1 Tax=Vitis vinifera TaxID=29760 RepID=D7TL23_VITVI
MRKLFKSKWVSYKKIIWIYIHMISKKIEKNIKDKKKLFLTSETNISPNKASYNAKRLESQKSIWQILKRRNSRLIRKLHYFIKNFIERIYIDILLCLINIPRSNAQFFIESTKKIIDKYIFNNERNQKVISKPNQKKIHFISIIKRWSSRFSTSSHHPHSYCCLFSLSSHLVY